MLTKLTKSFSKSLFYHPVQYNTQTNLSSLVNLGPSPNNANDMRISLSTGEIPFFKIVLTGGPCSGKSSSLKYLSKKLSQLGFSVYKVPEVSTFTQESTGLIQWNKLSLSQLIRFQMHFMLSQFALEDYFTNLAIIQGKPSVILCDRGLMDSKAYLSEEAWQLLLDEMNWNHIMLRDKRYDGVLHLVTVADGLEEAYTTSNNEIRTEDAASARKVDLRLRDAWCGHPAQLIIDNSLKSGFDSKLDRIYNGICKLINRPTTGRLHKYIIEDPSRHFPPDITTEKVNSEIVYLKSEGDLHERKIVKRGLLGQNAYFKVSKRFDEKDRVIQYLSYPLTAIQYLRFSQDEASSRKKLLIEETCFVWNARTYVIHKMLNLEHPMTLLRIMVDSDLIEPIIPPFIKVKKTVTGDRKFSGFRIAEWDGTSTDSEILN